MIIRSQFTHKQYLGQGGYNLRCSLNASTLCSMQSTRIITDSSHNISDFFKGEASPNNKDQNRQEVKQIHDQWLCKPHLFHT